MKIYLAAVYRFKPGRTFAQSLAGLIGADALGVLDANWEQSLSASGLIALVTFLQIWSEGGDMFADDTRVTRSAQVEPEFERPSHWVE